MSHHFSTQADARNHFKNVDLVKNYFDEFHREIAAQTGLLREEVCYLRRIANGQNTISLVVVTKVITYSIMKKKLDLKRLLLLEKKRKGEKFKIRRIAWEDKIDSLHPLIQERENILEKLQTLSSEKWEIIMKGITVSQPEEII